MIYQHKDTLIIFLIAITCLILLVIFIADLGNDDWSVFGQQAAAAATTTSTATVKAVANQTAVKVVNAKVDPLQGQVDDLSSQAPLLSTAVAGVITAVSGKFLVDRRGNKQNQDYTADGIKIVMNNVMDDYNDVAELCKMEIEIQNLAYLSGNETKPYLELLKSVKDPVNNETWGAYRKKKLQNIVDWNTNFYKNPSKDPTIVCPNPNNAIARQTTEIRRVSTDK